MKTISNATPAFVSGAQESARLQIEANGKAFKELISGIYSDKTYAIARELIANAWDAHVLAGNGDRPFDLHLPTVFDPVFSIRDYGTSMDHNTVMTLYRTLFRSTKDDPNNPDSNKFVGKFGLGSKSPFAYTDAFQLTTYLDGTQRVYDIYFNAGAPMISLFLECETEEENGVLITFPVESSDVEDFARAAARAMEPLIVQPNLTGRKVSVPERKVLFSGNGWMLLDGTFSDAAEALQGTVLYPLRFASIPNCPVSLKPLIEAPLRIEFEIGQLDVTTSREALSYDEVTSKNIITRLEDIVDEVRQSVADELSKFTTYFAWCNAYFTMKVKFPAKVWAVIENNPPKFKGRYAPTAHIKVNLADARIKQKTQSSLDGSVAFVIETKPRFKGLECCIVGRNSYQRYIHDSFLGFKPAGSFLTIGTDSKLVLVLQDTSKRLTYAHERMKVVLEQNGYNKTYLWIRHPGDAQFALKRLFAYLGRPSFERTVDLSTIPVPEMKKIENIRDQYKEFRNGEWMSPNEDFDPAAEIYFIHTRRGNPENKQLNRIGNNAVVHLFKRMQVLGLIDPKAKLVAVPVSAKSSFFSAYEAKEFEPVLFDYLKANYNREKLALQLVEYDVKSKYHRSKGHVNVFSPPWIYTKFKTIAVELSDVIEYEGKKKPTRYNRDKKSTTGFEKLIEGTCIEDAYILWMLREDAVKKDTVNTDILFDVLFDGDKTLKNKERKEIEKLRKKLQHQFNVAGGKVHREFPILETFNSYNVTDNVKKMVLRLMRKQIGA